MSDILPYQFEPIAPHNLTDEEFSSEDESDENNEEQQERVGNAERTFPSPVPVLGSLCLFDAHFAVKSMTV